MKNRKNIVKRIIVFVIIICNVTSVSLAAWWWREPGYQWCLQNGITSIMTTSALDKDVTTEDFYLILLRYLRLKNVRQGNRSLIQSSGFMRRVDPIIMGMVNNINKYMEKQSLTPTEYRQAITYIDHAESNISTHMSLVDREDAKDFFLYLSLARYKVATLIDDYEYRTSQVAKYSNVKYKDIFLYGMKPYFGKITRKEFLVLMFSLLSNKNSYSADSIIQVFYESGVLEGYVENEQVFELDERISYAEMFAFLHRFEAFDFESLNVQKAEDSNSTNEDEL